MTMTTMTAAHRRRRWSIALTTTRTTTTADTPAAAARVRHPRRRLLLEQEAKPVATRFQLPVLRWIRFEIDSGCSERINHHMFREWDITSR
jgi:hypothetical protein